MVHGEFVRLVNERASLWQEVQRLRRRILAGEASGDFDSQAVLFGEADAHVHAVRILSTAQVTADRYVADAQAYSSRVTEEARLRRDDIMREAQQHSDMILEDAHSRARDAAVSALNVPGRRRRPTASAGPPRPNWPTCAPTATSTGRTCGPTPRACCRASRSGSARRPPRWPNRAHSRK